MTYKTILVSLNEVGRTAESVAAGAALARELGAHVSGLYVIPAVQVYPSVGFEAAPQVFEGNRTFFKDNAARVKQAFEQAMSSEGLSFDFHQVDSHTPVIADEVVAQGRSADLIVVSATNPDEITGVERDFVEQVVMSAGRPVIVLPHAGNATLSLKDMWWAGMAAARPHGRPSMRCRCFRRPTGSASCASIRRRIRACAAAWPGPTSPRPSRAMA